MTWQAGSDTAFCVGDRPLFAFWPLLQPFTRNVLLSPHSHVSDQTVTWSWLELEQALTPTAAQLSGVRKRLEAAVAAISDTIAEEPPASTQQILSVAASVLKGLAMKSDSALLAFCAATVSGVMVHSWSFRRAAVPSSLDSGEREIQGTVSVGGTATEGQEVVLEDIRGSVLARTRTDRDGSFIFGDLAPGRFRVRGVSDQIDFSVTGLVVDVTQGGVRGLQLKSTATRKPRSTKEKNPSADMVADDARAVAAHSLPATTPGSRVDHQGRDHRWRGMMVLGLLTVIGGAGLFFWSNSRGRNGQDDRDIGVEKGAWAEAEAQKTPVLPERMETQKMLEERRRQLAAGWRQTSSKGVAVSAPSTDSADRLGTDHDVVANGLFSTEATATDDLERETSGERESGTDATYLGPDREAAAPLAFEENGGRKSVSQGSEIPTGRGGGADTRGHPTVAQQLSGGVVRGLSSGAGPGASPYAANSARVGSDPLVSEASPPRAVPRPKSDPFSPGLEASPEVIAEAPSQLSAIKPDDEEPNPSEGNRPKAAEASPSRLDGMSEELPEDRDHSRSRVGPRIARSSNTGDPPNSYSPNIEIDSSNPAHEAREGTSPGTGEITRSATANPAKPSSEKQNPRDKSLSSEVGLEENPTGRVMLPNLSLSRLMTATLTPPRLVLSQDAVLMTRPVLEGAEENVEEQRQMALQASQRQLPAAFAGAELSEGILFSIPAALLSRPLAYGQSFRKEHSFTQQAPPLVWKDAAGLSVDLGKSAAGRTELAWKRVLAAPGRYRLVDLRDQCWAEVEVGERGQVEVAVVPHVQTQVWIEARFNHEQSAPSDKAPWRDRLVWKSLDGRNLPRKSELGPSVLPDGSLRMEWVVEAKPGANLIHRVALVDTVSHWAWLSVVQQTF